MFIMTRTLARYRRIRQTDAGFSMVEILVSLGILMVVSGALAAMLVGAIQSTNRAKLYTQAKNLVQQQAESMRALIYHVDAGSLGSAATTKLDMLDNYYPNTTAAPGSGTVTAQTAQAGWVSLSNTARFTGEPTTGSFYRVVSSTTLDKATYRIVVDTQFLSSGATATPVEPPTGYNYSDTNGLDSPPATVVGVTMTASWIAYSKTKIHQSYTRIDQSAPERPTVQLQGRVALLHVQSNLDADTI